MDTEIKDISNPNHQFQLKKNLLNKSIKIKDENSNSNEIYKTKFQSNIISNSDKNQFDSINYPLTNQSNQSKTSKTSINRLVTKPGSTIRPKIQIFDNDDSVQNSIHYHPIIIPGDEINSENHSNSNHNLINNSEPIKLNSNIISNNYIVSSLDRFDNQCSNEILDKSSHTPLIKDECRSAND